MRQCFISDPNRGVGVMGHQETHEKVIEHVLIVRVVGDGNCHTKHLHLPSCAASMDAG